MSISKRGQGWEVRWRLGGQQYSKGGFRYKRDAEAFEAEQQGRIKNNTFTSPKEAKATLAAVYEDWISHKNAAPRTLVDYRELWKSLIAPTWGNMKLEQIKPDGVTKWVFKMNQSHSPARVRKAFTVFNQTLDFAVLGEKIQVNPAARAKQLSGKKLLPKQMNIKTHRYLTNDEVFALANASTHYRAMLLVMAYTGTRFGEVTALRVRDVDLLRNRLLVQRAWTSVQGKLMESPTKSGNSREIPIPQVILGPLKEIIESSTSPEELLFTAAKGGPIHYARWRRDFFDKAVVDSGIQRLTPHDLRHTYASLSIHAGVGPKAVQVAMGHSDIRVTMDTYAGLFESDKDDHAARLDAGASKFVSQTNVRKMFA